jgi:hypothetical protein
VNNFQLRKDVYDYLKTSLPDVDVLSEHPISENGLKPKLVVSILDDFTAGRYNTDDIENIEIQLTYYSQKELEITKPNGLLPTAINLMKDFYTYQKNNNPDRCINYHRVGGYYIGYVMQLALNTGYLIYRFYSHTI